MTCLGLSSMPDYIPRGKQNKSFLINEIKKNDAVPGMQSCWQWTAPGFQHAKHIHDRGAALGKEPCEHRWVESNGASPVFLRQRAYECPVGGTHIVMGVAGKLQYGRE